MTDREVELNKYIVVGKGTVGEAWGKALKSYGHEVVYHDPKKNFNLTDSFNPDGAFICVPTPTQVEYQGDRTSQDISNVFDSLDLLAQYDLDWISIRSTVTPSAYDALKASFKNPPLIAHPEFLRERHAEEEAEYPELIVVGGDEIQRQSILDVYPEDITSSTPIIETGFRHAFTIKYAANIWFATKVVAAYTIRDIWENQVNDAEKPDEDLLQALQGIDRIFSGRHTDPYQGGKKGFGGMCLPKDTKLWQNEGFEFIDALVEINEKWRGGNND